MNKGLDTIVYTYVTDDTTCHALQSCSSPNSSRAPNARYTKGVLRQTLQLTGCKPRVAHKAAEKVFRVLQQRASLHEKDSQLLSSVARLRPGYSCVTLARSQFQQLVVDCLTADNESLSDQHLQDFAVSCRYAERVAISQVRIVV